MNKEIEAISREIGAALDKIAVRSQELTPNDAILRYEELESSFLPKLANHSHLLLELKRRVTEGKLFYFLTTEYEHSFADVELHYDAICRLGFTDIEKEATIKIAFSRYCLRKGNSEKAKSILDPLHHTLSKTLEANDSDLYQRLLLTVGNLL